MNKKYKILIVEDQAITAMEIKHIVLGLGLDVVGIAKSNQEAVEKFEENLPDIVIMDINLEGDRDGISTVKDIYEISKTSVIYLTAFNDDKTIDRAIETYPLAYEIKPFNKASLQSTIKIVMTKLNKDITERPISNIDLGYGYSFNQDTKKLYFNSTFIKLGHQETELLSMLIKSKGQIVSYKQIENEIWEGNVISDSSIRTLIWRLRTKFEYKIIETVPYEGIKLVINTHK
ncbi:response regulator [Halarcobacter sp.]|uniref:response regulator n=1 Tax=Halarcobacter sp. TaxID=2321133 RepID=UPI002AA8B0BA|nr:response regulator [Halarcobacter sp.]